MNTKDIWKLIQRETGTDPDGIPGPKTLAALASALGTGSDWKSVQRTIGAGADGIPGPVTAQKAAVTLGIALPRVWPTQAEVRSGKSIFGKFGDESNLASIKPPYPMYYDGQPVKTIRVHKEIVGPLLRIFDGALEYYGPDGIRELGLDQWGGAFNARSTTGGNSKSMHGWGIAVDLDPERNGMKMHKPQARLSHPDAEAFWDLVRKEGAVSLGEADDYDWMHFQFARLK